MGNLSDLIQRDRIVPVVSFRHLNSGQIATTTYNESPTSRVYWVSPVSSLFAIRQFNWGVFISNPLPRQTSNRTIGGSVKSLAPHGFLVF